MQTERANRELHPEKPVFEKPILEQPASGETGAGEARSELAERFREPSIVRLSPSKTGGEGDIDLNDRRDGTLQPP